MGRTDKLTWGELFLALILILLIVVACQLGTYSSRISTAVDDFHAVRTWLDAEWQPAMDRVDSLIEVGNKAAVGIEKLTPFRESGRSR